MNIVMIGTGYVGLTTGIGFASIGHRVACVDKDIKKISMLDVGKVPFYEPELSLKMKELQESGNIMFTSDLSNVIANADVLVVAVQTPPAVNGQADLSYIMKAADEIGRSLDHEALIVIKSTVPVGTTEKFIERVKTSLRNCGRDELADVIQIAFVPEFLREGTALSDFLRPDRIVLGAKDEVAFIILSKMHENINTKIIKTTIESAEIIKYAANAFLATKISFINEIANIAEITGGNIIDIVAGVGTDSRIGPKFLNAGIGYGGSCFPKDVSALKQIAGTNGYDFKLLSAVIETNNRQRDLFFKKILLTLRVLKGRRIGVWGLSFKPNTDDIRESAAIDLVQRLVAYGADVSVYDPKAMENSKKILPDSVVFCSTPIDAAEGVEALLVLTEWPEFKKVSFATMITRMVRPLIFDGRNCLIDMKLESSGFEYQGVGLCGLKK